MTKHNDKGRLPAFIPVLRETMRTPAWLATSKGARWLFVVIKGRYSQNFRNKLYVSSRVAAKELGSDQKDVLRWFRELEHYGFIVKTSEGCLGVHGKGKAPHWRVTELGTVEKDGTKVAPTRDYLNWNSIKFTDGPKTESRGGNPPHPAGKSPSPLMGKSPSLFPQSAGEIPCIEPRKVMGKSPSFLV